MEGERTIRNITIHNLLTMTAPYKYKVEPYEMFFSSNNPIKDALDLLGGDGAIDEFNYAAIGGTQILSGILTRATGQTILDFATGNFFSPLDIHIPHNIVLHSKEEHITVMNDINTSGWAVDPQGNNTAGWGLFLTPADMAKVGQLYLNGGIGMIWIFLFVIFSKQGWPALQMIQYTYLTVFALYFLAGAVMIGSAKRYGRLILLLGLLNIAWVGNNVIFSYILKMPQMAPYIVSQIILLLNAIGLIQLFFGKHEYPCAGRNVA